MDLLGAQTDGTVVSNLRASRRVVVVGEEPLLEAVRSTNSLVPLILYAPVGSTNAVETNGDLPVLDPWRAWQHVIPTNLLQALPPLPATDRTLFIRAVQG